MSRSKTNPLRSWGAAALSAGAIFLAGGGGLLADGLDRVGALGRLEPRGGVRHVYGPPHPVAVIEALHVEEGDRVAVGDVIALLAGIGPARAELERARAVQGNAQRELERSKKLSRSQVVSPAQLEALETASAVARAELVRSQEEVALYTVRSPIAGRVLEIHVRAGERVGPEGIAELGDTEAMYAIAEVYETDAARIGVGQRARIRSPALPRELDGVVERVGLKIDKNDVLTTDPVADADARVVEVEIRITDPGPAARLTNLRVEVVIDANREAAAP